MQLIVVTDIFGKTKFLQQLLGSISDQYTFVEIVDPYDGKEIDFTSESEAYAHFQKCMGVDAYTEKLLSKLQRAELLEQIILGFSVGASAVWKASEKLVGFKETKAICFYSSQIRKYVNIWPEIEIDFYFAKEEPVYDVDNIILELSSKTNVQCYATSYLHGFMNRKSSNFNEQGYNNYIEILKKQ